MYFNTKRSGKMKKHKGNKKLAKSGVAMAKRFGSVSSTHAAAKKKGKRNLKKAC